MSKILGVCVFVFIDKKGSKSGMIIREIFDFVVAAMFAGWIYFSKYLLNMNIATEFNIFFKNKLYKPFIAPFDIILKNEKEEYRGKVIPDISIICDKIGLRDVNYTGVPTLL